MAVGTWSYTEATNLTVVTGGTSGTPTTFADFVAADRAGVNTDLLPAEGSTVNHTLTYQVRPVEDLAITIDFILDSTSAGSGDTLDVTGTLFDGSAQTDNIDVSGGDGTYNGAYKWATISDIDCTGWADGTLEVEQNVWGVIWDYGNGQQYRVDAIFNIGNGAASTYFTSLSSHAFFADTVWFSTLASATLTLGAITTLLPTNGSVWSIKGPIAWKELGDTDSTVNIYGSTIQRRFGGCALSFRGTTTVRNGLILSIPDPNSGDTWLGNLRLGSALVGVLDIDDLFTSKFLNVYIQPNSAQIDKLKVHNISTRAIDFSTTSGSYTNINITAAGASEIAIHNATGALIDPVNNITVPEIYNASGILKEQYTCNIHITDKEGAGIVGVMVLCNDTTAQAFSVTTDANGDIAEQIITYKKWATTSETETAYSPHKFTISKKGYLTHEVSGITVDSPINWTIKLFKSPHERILGIE